ncbi:hypothetical protein D3C84_1284720 [compost metagenome]
MQAFALFVIELLELTFIQKPCALAMGHHSATLAKLQRPHFRADPLGMGLFDKVCKVDFFRTLGNQLLGYPGDPR